MEKTVREEINGELDIFGFSKNKSVVDHLVDLIESGRVKGVKPNEVAEEFIAFACTLSDAPLEENLKQFDEIFFTKHKKVEIPQKVQVFTPRRSENKMSALSTPKMTPISVRRKNADSSMDDELSKLYGVSATPTPSTVRNNSLYEKENVENLVDLAELIELQAEDTNSTYSVVTAKTFGLSVEKIINVDIENDFVDKHGVWVEKNDKSEKNFVVNTSDYSVVDFMSKKIDTISRLICASNGLPTNFHSLQVKTDTDVYVRGVFNKFVGFDNNNDNKKNATWYFQGDETVSGSKRVLVNFEKCEPPFYFFPGMIAVVKGSLDDNFVLNAKKVYFNKKTDIHSDVSLNTEMNKSFGVFCGPCLNKVEKDENDKVNFFSIETAIDEVFSKIFSSLSSLDIKMFFLLGPIVQIEDISFADKILVTKMVMKRLSQFCSESQIKCFYVANENDVFCVGNCFPSVNFYYKFYCDMVDEYSPNLIVLKNPEKIILDKILPISFISTDVLLEMNSQKVAVDQTKNRMVAIAENLFEQNNLYPLLNCTNKRVDIHLMNNNNNEANCAVYDKLPPPKMIFFNSILQHFINEIEFDKFKTVAVNPGRLLKKTGAIVNIDKNIETKIIKF